MNDNQIKLLKKLYEIELQQPNSSQYWDSDGGQHIWELANFVGLPEKTIETELNALTAEVKITTRKDGRKGARLLQPGLDAILAVLASEKEVADAQAAADAITIANQQLIMQAVAVMAVLKTLPNFDQVVADIIKRAKELTLV